MSIMQWLKPLIVLVAVIIVTAFLESRVPTNDRSGNAISEIPDGITQEEHESHHNN